MPKIHLLPPTLINQIAAGEVVVRPASVVKELVENSLDAGAAKIDVEITNGTRDIVVTDDGCGMERDDAELALTRHATSKISSIDDLGRLRTAGFRGEAVPSIAAVARLRILSRTSSSLSGTLVHVEGGDVIDIGVHAAPPGTRVEARDLFYNVPARRKFLKSPQSELQAIHQIVLRLALANPNVGFQLSFQGRTRLNCRGGVSLEERLNQLLGNSFSGQWRAVDATWTLTDKTRPDGEFEVHEDEADGESDKSYKLTGYVAAPAMSAKDRARQWWFANGRPIAHRRLSHVMEEAGRGFIMAGMHPIAALFLTIPDGDLDVNVHPTKEEVRFAREATVCSLTYRAIKAAWERASLPQTHEPIDNKPKLDRAAIIASSPLAVALRAQDAPSFPEHPSGHTDNIAILSPRPSSTVVRFDADETPSVDLPSPMISTVQSDWVGAVPNERESATLEAEELQWIEPSRGRLLGQAANCYLVLASGEDLVLIDQHAAQERLYYHRFTQSLASGSPHTQSLLVPHIVDVAPGESEALDELAAPLAELGIVVEPFGGASWQILGGPADMPRLNLPAVVRDLVSEWREHGASLDPDAAHLAGNGTSSPMVTALRHRVAARLACRASVKSGQALSRDEMEALLRDLRSAKLPFLCPHGRPTIVRLAHSELDALFKRR